jgi:hypothetical protein
MFVGANCNEIAAAGNARRSSSRGQIPMERRRPARFRRYPLSSIFYP